MIFTDIPRLNTALAEWAACMIYVLLLKKRFSKGMTALISVVSLIFLTVFMMVTANVGLALWLPCMIAAVLWMFATLWLLLDATVRTSGYLTACAFMIAEFSASIEWQLEMYFGHFTANSFWWHVLMMLIFITLLMSGFYFLEKKYVNNIFASQIARKDVISAFCFTIIAFALSNISFVSINTPFTAIEHTDINIMRTLVDACGIAILYSSQVRICEYYAEKEVNTIRSMLKNQYDQYRYYQQSMEMIHIKYHDLKHQITGLRYETDNDKRKEWLDQLEKELDDNHIVDRTGNQVLDTMLGAKIFQASKNQIRITCVADGKLLSFMHVTDICTIFGNALDNAIENAVLIEDPEKRMIHVTVSAQKGFVLINISNYFEGKIEMKNNSLPKTTKHDRSNHGFGLKSIGYAVEKYNGTMSVSAENNWFELKILMPKHEK
ncbi:MAG: GHKL domain-containing protein [Lachnospiraceae bacterium]|nr:GHKL domain-containing protein [Lachnospiraceae bacterium]